MSIRHSSVSNHTARFISHILGGSSTRHQTLDDWLSPVIPSESRWTRCYRAVDDGWSAYTFHTNCDSQGPTVTLVKAGEYIFGGFLDQPWGGKCRETFHVIYSNTRDNVSSDFQTPRRELKIRRVAEYFSRNSRCLEIG